MSDTRKDGGPAFPTYFDKSETHSDRLDGLPDYTARSFGVKGGMTLRDWFAGQWLAAGHHANLSPQEAAEQAYKYADAMLAAREAGQ